MSGTSRKKRVSNRKESATRLRTDDSGDKRKGAEKRYHEKTKKRTGKKNTQNRKKVS